MIQSPDTTRGIEDYRLVVAPTHEELGLQVQKLEDQGWTMLGNSAYLRRGDEFSRNVFIQPMVVYGKHADKPSAETPVGGNKPGKPARDGD